MQFEPTLLTGAMLAPFLLQALKRVWRTFVVNDPEYDFSKMFYTLTIPFSVLIADIVVGYFGWAAMPDVSVSFVLQWLLGIIVSMGVYQLSVRPFNNYSPNNR